MEDGLPSGWRALAANWAGEKDRIHELHLFGSRARGHFQPDSDVDLAYVLTGSDPGEMLAYSMFEACNWESELQLLLNADVQLHMADPGADAIVWPAVTKHGQLIYLKDGYLRVG